MYGWVLTAVMCLNKVICDTGRAFPLASPINNQAPWLYMVTRLAKAKLECLKIKPATTESCDFLCTRLVSPGASPAICCGARRKSTTAICSRTRKTRMKCKPAASWCKRLPWRKREHPAHHPQNQPASPRGLAGLKTLCWRHERVSCAGLFLPRL